MQERIIKIIEILIKEISHMSETPGTTIELLSKRLLEKGYTEDEIQKAVEWVVAHLDERRTGGADSVQPRELPAIRYLSDIELEFFSPEAHAYLIQLQSLRVLNPLQVEQIIERCALMGLNRVELEDLKSIVTHVLLGKEPGNLQTDSIYYPGNEKIN